MDRREFIRLGALGGAVAAVSGRAAEAGLPAQDASMQSRVPGFDLEEATMADLQQGMTEGRLTARGLAELYLARVAVIDRSGPALNSVIELNPEALSIAEALDRERAGRGVRGPLHGVPVFIKDNIDTADRMRTTAGSLALEGARPAADAFIVSRLRAAGAVILGKTNLSEWANFRSTRSSSGWSGRGGQTRNPYALDRSPSGSSSGSAVAVAANLCAVAVGTETDGSILSPASVNGLVGIKPTVGLVSRSGIIPISVTQDTAGPMARTVADAAALLGALAGVDRRDPATRESAGRQAVGYDRALDPRALNGVRLGVVRKLFGKNDRVNLLVEAALGDLARLGAELVDPVEVPGRDQFGEAELEVMLYEFKDGLNRYLAALGPDAPRTLEQLIEYNASNREREMPYFGQELFEMAQAKGPLSAPGYREALAKCRRFARTLGIDAALERHRLDALVAPTGDPAWLIDLVNGDHALPDSCAPAAVAGYPSVTVPAGFVFGLPVGLSFFGTAWSESRLIGFAYAYEQATRHRRSPSLRPSADVRL